MILVGRSEGDSRAPFVGRVGVACLVHTKWARRGKSFAGENLGPLGPRSPKTRWDAAESRADAECRFHIAFFVGSGGVNEAAMVTGREPAPTCWVEFEPSSRGDKLPARFERKRVTNSATSFDGVVKHMEGGGSVQHMAKREA